LRWRLGWEPDLAVVGAAGDPPEALRVAGVERPAVIVLDLRLQGVTQVALIRELRARIPQSALVILSATVELDGLRGTLDAECRLISKYQPPAELLAAIRAAAGPGRAAAPRPPAYPPRPRAGGRGADRRRQAPGPRPHAR